MMAPVAYDALLLASFGGPEGQEDVIPFLRNVTRGRGIPDERLEEVATHYRANGGISPINQQNRELKAAVEAELAERGLDLPVYWGNRNWEPYTPDVLETMYADGHRRVLAFSTSAYAGYSSCRQYREDYGMALRDRGLEGKLEVDKVRQYFDHPGFISPFIQGVEEGLEALKGKLADKGVANPRLRILFCTHSIPMSDAEAAGPRLPEGESYEGGNAYTAQHLAVARTVIAGVPGAADVPHELVYQSRSGAPHVPWLEPDVNDRLAEIADETDGVLMVPIGFVSDHMEVTWDLDTEATQTCGELGLESVRVPTPGTHPDFVAGLVDLIQERYRAEDEPTAEGEPTRASVVEMGPWADVCARNCCEKVMRDGTRRPTVAAFDAAIDAPVCQERTA
nr:ferrochelatase [Falsarthrobacter nasiphocae]